MSAIKAIFGWIFRNALVFALIVAALIAHAIWIQGRADEGSNPARIERELTQLGTTREKAQQLRIAAEARASQANAELSQFEEDMRSASVVALERERANAIGQLEKLRKRIPSSFAETRHVVTGDTAALAATALDRIEIARFERQLAFLEESLAIARNRRSVGDRLASLRLQLNDAASTFDAAQAECTKATSALKAFDDKWFGARWIAGGRKERRALASQKSAACFARDAAQTTRDAIEGSVAATREALDQGKARIDAGLTAATDALEELERQSQEREAEIARQLEEAKGGLGALMERYDLVAKARLALFILLGIIATPLLIRTVFYYVLAPIAERRAAIRIALPGTGEMPLPPTEPSRISIPVSLSPGEELLVRQDYLQTSPAEAEKATRWMLDYSHPLSSVATGLVFLTRLRGGGSTTVSAVRDPFAELAQISLPSEASCVLHPRALVAVVQPVGETMRITSHWRLFSLNAWLTMQLRFMVFHGPGRLIVKGGRGVRIEPATAGRIFGQDQLIGFSADLAYSVTRTETFAPYLFGREQLFKDKVEDGSGVLVIEEAPLAGRKGGEVRRGLEGAFDAALKAFGL